MCHVHTSVEEISRHPLMLPASCLRLTEALVPTYRRKSVPAMCAVWSAQLTGGVLCLCVVGCLLAIWQVVCVAGSGRGAAGQTPAAAQWENLPIGHVQCRREQLRSMQGGAGRPLYTLEKKGITLGSELGGRGRAETGDGGNNWGTRQHARSTVQRCEAARNGAGRRCGQRGRECRG